MQKQTTTYRKKSKRRPRWGRILGFVLALAVLGTAALLATKHRTSPPSDSQSQADTPAQSDTAQPDTPSQPSTPSGLVRSFTAPTAFSLEGMRAMHKLQSGDRDYNEERFYYNYLPSMSVIQLAYFDYPSQQQQLLCSVPGCAHNGADCEATLATSSTAGLACSPWNTWLTWRDQEGEYLQSISKEGQRAPICFQASDQEMFLTVVGENESALLFAVGARENDAQVGQNLYLYNKTSGDCLKFMMIGNQEVVGVYDHHFVLSHSKSVNMNEYTILFTSVDMLTGQEQLIYSSTETNRHMPVAAMGQYLYFLRQKDTETCEFVRKDIATQEETVLNDAVYYPESYAAATKQDILDGRFRYQISPYDPQNPDQSSYTAYTIDCETGEVQQDVSPAMLVEAVFADHYLVSGPSLSTQYALISKADFWAGNPNYIPIADLAG